MTNETHDAQVRAVTRAVAKLLPKLHGLGFTPEAIFEGAIKGGAVALLTREESTTDDVAGLLSEMAEAFRDVAEPNQKPMHN